MRLIAILSLLALSVPALAQERSDDACAACLVPQAPPLAPATIAVDPALPIRPDADYEARHRHIRHLMIAGGVVTALGTAMMPIGVGLQAEAAGEWIDHAYWGPGTHSSPYNHGYWNGAVSMYSIGAPMILAGVTMIGVAAYEKKQLNEAPAIPANQLVSSLGVAPIALNGAGGAVAQWALSF